MLATGLFLTVSAIIARIVVGSAAQPAQATLMADAFLVGVVLTIAGVVTGGRR